MQDIIKKQSSLHGRTLVAFIVLFILFLWFSIASETPWVIFIAFLMFSGIIYTAKEWFFFSENFENPRSHLINWEYPNGDKLIVTCWGLLKFETEPPKAVLGAKFEGLKWDLDNAKNLAECLIKGEGNPINALVPSIGFSTTSNRIEDFITFGFVDIINLTFVEIGNGFLMIQIHKKNTHTKYCLTYPLPPAKKSIKEEVDLFEKRIERRKTPVRALFLEKSLMEEVIADIGTEENQ